MKQESRQLTSVLPTCMDSLVKIYDLVYKLRRIKGAVNLFRRAQNAFDVDSLTH